MHIMNKSIRIRKPYHIFKKLTTSKFLFVKIEVDEMMFYVRYPGIVKQSSPQEKMWI